ncbi:MAG: dihydrodipicolinate synthase family protein [Alphaproteobacteria bacterium]|nr:dihydrodipicolinate synthase family protein [Alphaproteobacteria bacterium]MBV9202159.1 dihydrodipicolinate synthase family protein [Alphaproteobacteria bacterium]
MAEQPFHGVLVPVLTPFAPNGEPDAGRFTVFCRWLLDQGAGGLSVFGTTSEANSMSAAERMKLLDALVEAGIPPDKLMPGTGACSTSEAAELVRHVIGHDCSGVLMLPPFYYKGVSDDGIFAFVSRVIDKAASPALRVYLYHIPPVAQVGYSLDLVGRLIKAYPQTVVGLKDSSGDWSNTAALLDHFPGFAVFPGSEVFLLDALRKGCAGCITASGNVNVPCIRKVYENWRSPHADALQAEITTLRKALQAYPMVPALKRIVAHFHGDPQWAAVRPPMVPLDEAQSSALIADLAKLGFTLGERPRSMAA